MQADMAGDRMRAGMARPTRWIPAEVWQRQGMTAQVLTLPGGTNSFFVFQYFRLNFKSFFSLRRHRCCNSNKFGGKIKHCFKRRTKGYGAQITQRHLHAIGNRENYCNTNGL